MSGADTQKARGLRGSFFESRAEDKQCALLCMVGAGKHLPSASCRRRTHRHTQSEHRHRSSCRANRRAHSALPRILPRTTSTSSGCARRGSSSGTGPSSSCASASSLRPRRGSWTTSRSCRCSRMQRWVHSAAQCRRRASCAAPCSHTHASRLPLPSACSTGTDAGRAGPRRPPAPDRRGEPPQGAPRATDTCVQGNRRHLTPLSPFPNANQLEEERQRRKEQQDEELRRDYEDIMHQVKVSLDAEKPEAAVGNGKRYGPAHPASDQPRCVAILV